jgi:uncharacterized alkaline shock family protein YloU
MIGLMIILVAWKPEYSGYLIEFYTNLKETADLRLIGTTIGAIMVIVSVFSANIVLARFQREKNIAFQAPDGMVRISLSAIDDFIRRLPRQVPELKEIKCDVTRKKNSYEVATKVVLWADVNIYEVTEKVQFLIKSKIQEILPTEETITVPIHVVKIAQRDEKMAKREEQPVTLPPYR